MSGPITHGVISGNTTLAQGSTEPLTVAWYDASNAVVTPTVASAWTTSSNTLATVVSTGLESANVTAVAGSGVAYVAVRDPTTGVRAGTFTLHLTAGATAGAAQFLMTSVTSVSSLDTGRLGYAVAWGGNEFGYAYTYALDGTQPAGVTIDADMGVLSAGSPIAVGAHTFGVVVTNRENTSLSASLPFTITVRQGVTSNRTGTQILHKTYDPHSGTWGTPSGNNWQSVFTAMAAAIITDQVAAGNENHRATWLTRAGVTYQYTTNGFFSGIQYLTVAMDPAHSTGATPIFQNIVSDPGQNLPYSDGPLQFGRANAMNQQQNPPGIKSFCAKIATVGAGSTSITLLNSGDASKIKVGRWLTVIGQMAQVGGFPPNVMFIDYVIPTAVSGTTVTLDRPLKYGYDQTWWEDPTEDSFFGVAWAAPVDIGGTGGAAPSVPRTMLRGTIQDINFLTNPNAAGADISYMDSFIDLQFVRCKIPDLQCSMGKHFALLNCTLTSQSEPDKQIETLFFDGTTTGTLFAASGVQYFLARNSTFRNDGSQPDTCQISPSQFRSIGSTFDAGSSQTPPYTRNYQGPSWYWDFKSTVFTGTAASTGWTYPGTSFSPLTIGTDAHWSGNQLQIPSSFAHFEDWLINSYAGGIVAVTVNGLGPITTNWGYIASVSSSGNVNTLYLNIVWVNGTKPTSGTIDIVAARMRRVLMEPSCTFTGVVGYANARMTSQTVAPFGTNYGFPAGLPAPFNN